MPTTDKANCLDVLLIEDNPSPLVFLTDLLTNNGFYVRQYCDVKKALQSLQTDIPALMLLDVQDIKPTAYDIFQHLKTLPIIADVPVIFISAAHDTQSIKHAFELGVVDYIVKPYKTSELLSRIKMHLNLRKLQLRHAVDGVAQAQLLQMEVAQRRYAEAELLASRQQLLQLTGHLQSVREEERARIAREIHDELGQSLTAASLGLFKLQNHFNTQSATAEQQIFNIIKVLEHAANTARAISENLRPGMLDVLGLGPAIEHHVNNFSAITGICCKLSLANDGNLIVPEPISIAVFRIIQEALTNVARHAHAHCVTIQLADLGQELMLVMQDDGRGMPLEQGQHRNFGLLGMRERVALLGGEIAIGSKKGNGTRIEVCIPLLSAEVTA